MKKISLGFVLALVAANAAIAAPPEKPTYVSEKPVAGVPSQTFTPINGDERDAAISTIETYLSGITSMTADFTQASGDGSVGTGKFYLKRPGKMRWQYDEPTPILLVSDGKVVTYYDPGLDQVTYIGVDDTLAGFLTQKDIKFDSASTKLTKLEASGGVLRATLVQTKKPKEGSLTLELFNNPMEIRQIITMDTTGNETRVQLKNIKFGENLEDKLFTFVDPRGVHHKRKGVKR